MRKEQLPELKKARLSDLKPNTEYWDLTELEANSNKKFYSFKIRKRIPDKGNRVIESEENYNENYREVIKTKVKGYKTGFGINYLWIKK